MSDKGIHDVLELIARRGVPENINLWQGISSRLNRRFSVITLRKHPIAAILIALIIFLGVSGGVYALGRALGYIPGAGFVDKNASILVLKEPVSSISNGIQITIDQVVADPAQTTIFYAVEVKDKAALKPGAAMVPGEAVCENMPDFVSHSLRLPDGQILPGGSSGPDPNQPYEENGVTRFIAIDPPIPSGVDTFTFVLGCGQGEDTAQLVPAPKNFIMPVITVAPQKTQEIAQSTMTPADILVSTDQPNMNIESFVELDDGYILVGYLQYEPQDNRTLLPASFANITIADANGTPIEVQDVLQGQNYWPAENNADRDYWVIKVLGEDHTWPLTITHQPTFELSSVEVATFQIDLGANPQDGQSWKLDLDIPMGDIGMLHVDSVKLFKGTAPLEDPNSYSLDFSITNASPLVTLVDNDHESRYLGGGGGPEGYNIQLIYPSGYMPSGQHTMTVMYSGQYSDPLLTVDWKP